MEYQRIPENENKDKRIDNILLATRASWIVNWFLFLVKFYVFIFSRSKSIVAALVDSAGIFHSFSSFSFTFYSPFHSLSSPSLLFLSLCLLI